MTCTNCTQWNLKASPMRAHGLGLCKSEPVTPHPGSRTFSGANPCRFGKFAQAPAATVARRLAELQR